MKNIFEKMEEIGWNRDYANIENLEYEYKVLEKYYLEEVEKSSKSDAIDNLGFILDFVKAVMELNKKAKTRNDYLVKVPVDKIMKCNMCSGDLKHYNYNGTFIWTCESCSNIQVEINDSTDATELSEFLKLEERGEE